MKAIANNYLTAVLVALLVFFAATQAAWADTVVRSGENVSIAEEKVINGDFYSVAETLSVSGVVEEDLVAAGGQVVINGSVGSHAFLIAGSVDSHGIIGDDLRIVAGEVVIAEPVEGDVMVVGGEVDILSTASIAGDLLVYGGDVTVEAPVAGDVIGTVSDLRIDALVEGDVDVTSGQLTLGDRAAIVGSVTYESSNELIQAFDASVGGETVRTDPVFVEPVDSTWSWIIPSLMILFAALAWFLISKRSLNALINSALQPSPKPVLLGFATFILLPIAAILLFVSIVGSMLGFVLLFGYIVMLFMSGIAMMVVLGKLLQVAFSQNSRVTTLLTIIIGFVGYAVLSFLPVIGGVVKLILFILALGGITNLILEKRKHLG
tara:strand:+ start:7775 stop:8908 length:1134 start_codon:yes stop_codon:yes gene_type:complete